MTTNRVIPKGPAPSIDEADEVITNVASKDAAPKRPALREDSPKERARKRAEELRAHLGDIDVEIVGQRAGQRDVFQEIARQ